jgi:hypothetical protein
MTKRRFEAWWLFLGAAPVLIWLIVGFPLMHLDVIGDVAFHLTVLLLAGLAVVSVLSGSTLLIIRAFRASGTDRELERRGLPATGVVREIGEIGGTMTVNDNPVLRLVLEVHHARPEPYTVELETLIPRYALPMVQPERNLPLLVHPENRERLAIAWDAEDIRPPVYGVAFSAEEERLLDECGRRGMTTILEVRDSGRARGFQVLVELRLRIFLADTEPYEVLVELPLDRPMIEHLQGLLNRSVECLVNPDDPRRIKLLLDTE